MRKPLVSIVIVNWNGGEIFKNCLQSLSKINYPNWELIVVDNGSTDGSDREAKKLIRLTKLIKNKKNVGFARANNQGVKITRGKYILLLNNDTKVIPAFLDYLVEQMQKDNSLGVVQPKIKIMDNPRLLDNCGAFLTRAGFLEHWGYMARDGYEFNKEREVFSTKGACMLIRRNLIEKVGLFDEDFASYMEETDFCWRVWLAGYKVMFVPGATIYHKVGFTSKKMDQVFVNYHSFKNRLLSLLKNLGYRDLIIIGGTHSLLILALSFYYFIRLQFSKTFMIWKAIGWNIVNLPKTLKKRSGIQKMRKVGDKEIFKKVLRPIDWEKMFVHFAKVEANY